jgi:murein DD-endopeptidase MepM/ murein hydrolase activator NlpD
LRDVTPAAVNPVLSYQVQPGDTLNGIARRHGISVAELIRANRLSNPNLIEVSQDLVIPTDSTSPRLQPVTPRPVAIANLPTPRPIDNLNVEPKIGVEPKPTIIPTLSVSTADTPITVQPAIAPAATDKLKAEIDNLETTYGQPITGESASVVPSPELLPTPVEVATVREQAINPEWQSDRPTITTNQSEPEPIAYKPKDEQIIGAAPTDAQDYNNSLRLPVGYEVAPELPPLSSPENYLPDAPMKFSGYIWPAKGVLTSGYGRRWGRMHRGIDIAAPIGTPIVAAAAGEVTFAGWNSGGYGQLVKLRHEDGSVTLYAHNSRIFVRRGQQVNQGEPIAAMGSTGYSTGPHLHFEIHAGGKSAVNPIAYLPNNRN